MRTRIVRGYSDLNDLELIEKTQHISNSLTDNEHYPDAGDLVDEVKIATEALDAMLKLPKENRNGNYTLQKNEKRTMLCGRLDRLYSYIIYKADNDITMLTSSGFPFAKEAAKPKGNGQPKNFKVMGGDEAGSMLMQCKKVPGSEGYFFQYKQMPDADMSEWRTIQHKNNSMLITKLISGTKYSFRMASVGPTGKGEWSELITRFIP